MNETLAVAVETVPVDVVTLDGERTGALLYLHATGRLFAPETLGERLRGENMFLPCKVESGVELVNLDRVAYFDCPLDMPEIQELDELPSVRTAASLELASGERLAGDLRYRLPPFSCRISDLLNADERFLVLTGSDRCYYVNRRAVVRVRAGASACQ